MEKTIVVLFGGVSTEHEVSRVSASYVVENLPADYRVLKVGITKDGRWLYYPGGTEAMRTGEWEHDPACEPACISPDRGVHGLVRFNGGRYTAERVDVVFPVLHGKNGEDGTLQGLLDLSGIPYVGCGVLASSICMDKVVANTLFDAAGIPHCRWTSATRAELETDFNAVEAAAAEKLGYPIFVKPANTGSSVGVSKACDKAGLKKAAELALQFDEKVLFEETVVGHEVECAVLGNPVHGPADLLASTPGEILACNEFYDYDAKYIAGTSKTEIPAHVTDGQLDEVRHWARLAYTALGCSGLSRCDFFVRSDGRVLINEINTLPGFTSISMYPKLMEHDGLGYTELLRRLVGLAEERRSTLL